MLDHPTQHKLHPMVDLDASNHKIVQGTRTYSLFRGAVISASCRLPGTILGGNIGTIKYYY